MAGNGNFYGPQISTLKEVAAHFLTTAQRPDLGIVKPHTESALSAVRAMQDYYHGADPQRGNNIAPILAAKQGLATALRQATAVNQGAAAVVFNDEILEKIDRLRLPVQVIQQG